MTLSFFNLSDTSFLVSEQLPATSVTQYFAHAKTVRDKPSRRRKNSPLTRFALPFTLPSFRRFLVSHACHVRQLSARKSTPQRSLSRYGVSRTNKNSSRTLPYFRTVITTVNPIRCKIESRNSKNRSARMRICMIENKTVKENFRKNFPHMQIHSRTRRNIFLRADFHYDLN